MDNINKAAAVGVVFFMVVLAGFVGMKVDQTTIALLGGAFIGLVIAIPTTVLIIAIGMRRDTPAQSQMPPAPPPAFPQMQPPVTHNYYDNRRVVVVVNVPDGTQQSDWRFVVARELRVMPMQAQRMIDAGEVQCLPAGR